MIVISNIKKNTFIFTSIVFAFTIIISYFLLNYKLDENIDKEFKKICINTNKIFISNIKNEKDELLLLIDGILSIHNISEIIAKKDRKQINLVMAPYYAKIKKQYQGIEIITFRDKNNIVFYRAHKPQFYGDALNKKRKLIIDTARLKTSLSGFEVGKFALTYRVTKPIFYKNKYIGNIEIGLNSNYFAKDISNIMNLYTAIAINKSQANVMLNKNMVSINNQYAFLYGDKNILEHYKKNNDSLKIKMEISLKNHLDENVGYLIIGYDISKIKSENNNFILKLLLGLSIVMILVISILLKGYNQILKYFTKKAYSDDLTGLGNRQLLYKHTRGIKRSVLIVSNIKDFSLLNEIYGLREGNKILKEVAKEFKKFAKEFNFYAYRISSDEFVLFKKGEHREGKDFIDILSQFKERIHALDIYIEEYKDNAKVEMYCGVVFDSEHPLEESQIALKNAKNKNLTYLIYSKILDSTNLSTKIIKMKKKIHFALDNNNVLPFFQPIVNNKGEIIKYEALVRILEFDDGKTNILPPLSFLDISIKSGLYNDISKVMLNKSLSFFENKKEKISVNFLPNDFYNEDIVQTFLDAIKGYNNKDMIVVEVTEQQEIEDFPKFAEVINKFRKVGVLIAIDDFGSGYANYQDILMLKPDYIKIDGSLVKNILTNKESNIFVKSIINFAKELNIIVIAEYVENEEIFNLLKKYGAGEFQGYYFGKPIDLLHGSL